MINVNDIIKFSDYKDIYLKEKDYFMCKSQFKNYNIKGDKVEKYILPIFYDLFQPNRISTLLDTLKENNHGILLDNFEIEFLNILSKLYRLGVIQILDYDDIKYKYKLCIEINEKHPIMDDKIINSSKYKKLTIFNFLNLNDIKLFIAELSTMPFNNINIINIVPDIINIEKDIICEIDDEKYKISYIKYSDIKDLNEEILTSELLLTLNSALNVDLNSIINEYCIKYKIPWLSCLVNDVNIEIGPLVVYNKTACYECYKYINGIKGVILTDSRENHKISIRTYDINRRSNLLIAFGYILDEIFKLIYLDKFNESPLTIDSIISIKGSNLDYMMKDFIKVPNCSTCRL